MTYGLVMVCPIGWDKIWFIAHVTWEIFVPTVYEPGQTWVSHRFSEIKNKLLAWPMWKTLFSKKVFNKINKVRFSAISNSIFMYCTLHSVRCKITPPYFAKHERSSTIFANWLETNVVVLASTRRGPGGSYGPQGASGSVWPYDRRSDDRGRRWSGIEIRQQIICKFAAKFN